MLMMVASTVCWGSWANTYKQTKGYRFELFYWDYAIGIVLISLALALTLGSRGGPDSFASNLRTADTSNIVLALVGGFIFNIANLLLVAGIEMAGLAVAFPLSIGIALIEGVVLSYALQPKGDPWLLGTGVGLAVVAVIAVGKAYGSLSAGNVSASGKSIVVCVVSGVLMGAFAPFVTRALTAGHPLTPYGIAVFFTTGALLCCFVVNIYFMKRPLVGEPVDFSGYFRQRAGDHLLGLFGGAVWGTGTVFNFVAAGFVGVAISYAIGQAAPMVAALWGVLVWKEFRGANGAAKAYLTATFVFYLLALGTISKAYDSSAGPQSPRQVRFAADERQPRDDNRQPAIQKIILDTDFVVPPGDDAMALLLALKSPELQILGVTTVAGNDTMERATSDALRVLEIADRADIPVYKGAKRPLHHERSEWATTAYGRWWSDDPPPMPPGGFAKRPPADGSATDFIVRTVNANPTQVVIAAIGPLTNIATAIRSEPALARKIKRLVIMGGAIASLPDGAGNMTPNAEFNIWVDPEAARIVFRSGIPITMTPLNVTRKTKFSREWYDRIVAARTPVTALIEKGFGPLFARDPGLVEQMYDQLAIGALVDPTLVKTVEMFVDVDDQPGPSYGVTVGGDTLWEGADGAKQVTVQYDVDFDRFIHMFVQRVSGK